MRQCAKCGQQQPDANQFCRVCGASMKDATNVVAPEKKPILDNANFIKLKPYLPFLIALIGWVVMYYISFLFSCIILAIGVYLGYENNRQQPKTIYVIEIIVNVVLFLFAGISLFA